MFAGRYMWWVLVCTALFLFFSVFFPKLAFVFVASSGCDVTSSGCGGLISFLDGAVQPLGFIASGGVLLLATASRVFYVRLHLVWILFFAVWFVASTDFFIAAGEIWMATGGMLALADSVPPEALYLAVLTLYLCFPLEDYDNPPNAALSGIQWLSLSLAGLVSLISFLSSEQLAQRVFDWSGSDFGLRAFEAGRALFSDSGLSALPQVWLFLSFLVLLALQGILRTRPLVAD